MTRVLRKFAILALIPIVRTQDSFTDTVPEDYYLRKDLSDCSQRFHQPKYYDNRCLVFGGKEVNVTEFPHMAVLGWVYESENRSDSVQWQCGGSLITERFVLTAAHCEIDADNIPPRLVRLGDVNLASSVDDEYAQQFEIRRFVRHPKHRHAHMYFDLALVELDGVVRLTPAVCPACLWSKLTLPAEAFEVAGFGETSFGSGSVPNLMKTGLLATNATHCARSFANTRGLPDGIAEDQMCATFTNADTCQGDSGGPLQVSLRSFFNQHPFVVAVTSFGRGCGTGSSGVYQQVAAHIPWIESVVNESMDSLRCTEKYGSLRVQKFLIPECSTGNAFVNRVELVWPKEATVPDIPCSGTLIDYNTVVTSARCVQNEADERPSEIVLFYNRAAIVEVQIHPEFDRVSLENDLALLRLDKYVIPNEYVAPSCIPLPEQAEICTDDQTHDRVACWDQFTLNTKRRLLDKLCRPASIQSSVVKLVWSGEQQTTGNTSCVGMAIKPSMIITSIRCMNDHGPNPPVEIELSESAGGKRVKITKILRHPGYKEGVRDRDTALLLLEDTVDNVPQCFDGFGNKRSNITQVTVFGRYDPGKSSPGHVHLPIHRACNESLLHTFKEQLGERLADSTRYTCWDSEQKVAPGAVPLEQGSGFLDPTHRFIRGVATSYSSFGSVDPLITLNLTSYIDWITRFVLYRPPKQQLVFRGGDDEFEQGSSCVTKTGTEGNCMPEYGCERLIKRHKNSKDITICGFEGTISYVCCPIELQDFVRIPEIVTPSAVRLLPALPYENL